MKYIRLYESFRMINEQQGQIYKRPKDPYEYKVEDDNWLSRRKGTDKWFNITGGDFKPAYQKSIDLLDKEFPDARTEEAPKRGGEATPKENAPKQVEYTRDNGETAKGKIVDVDKDKEVVTIKAPSGKEFEKPFDKIEMASDELKKLAETPPPAETKKEEKPAETKKEEKPAEKKSESDPAEDQKRMLKASTLKRPEGLGGFFEADEKAVEYLKTIGPIVDGSRTFVYPFPPEGKKDIVYLTGYFDDQDKIVKIYLRSPREDETFIGKEEVKDAFEIATEVLGDLYPKAVRGTKTQVDEEARKKSKAADEAEDKMTTSKSGTGITK